VSGALNAVSQGDLWNDSGSDRVTTRPRWLALLVGIFLLSLYLLTMGGHLDSPDEEVMFQVTRSLAERGALDVPPSDEAPTLSQPGLGGASYAPYGVVPSVVGLPFYLAGKVAAEALPPRFGEVVPRFFFGMRNAFVSAAVCALTFLFCLRLGYGERVSVALSLALGGSTLVWVYARHAFSEPVTTLFLLLAVYAAFACLQSGRWPWSLVSGLALGLAVGSKITTLVALPPLVGYLLLALHRAVGTPPTLRARLVRRVLPFSAALGLPAVALAAVNLARFGDVTQTGYKMDDAVRLLLRVSEPVGLLGLTVSPGKSIVVYAPVAALSLVGGAAFFRRFAPETLLFATIALGHVVVYGILSIWSGDAAWGPRYLVPVTPLLVLPAGAALRWPPAGSRGSLRFLFVSLLLAGVAANLGGVLMDQRVYFAQVDRSGLTEPQKARLRYWAWPSSPVVAHWGLLLARWQDSLRRSPLELRLESGAYGPEPAATGSLPRWTTSEALFSLPAGADPAVLRLRYSDQRPARLGPAQVTFLVDGQALPEGRIVRRQDDSYTWTITVYLEGAPSLSGRSTIAMRVPTWSPARDRPPSTDTRELGVLLEDGRAWLGDRLVLLTDSPAPPLPVSDAQPWGPQVAAWFYVPSGHLLDSWLWYLSLAGLPRGLLLLGFIPLAGVVLSGRLLLRLCACPGAYAAQARAGRG